ncbi:transmembrane protein 203-like [Ostrea edulis]|uniref:transmembrane protein 203-like n=1 Tax=Ostrea edulis TaxID=37623 RepID=UPI0024AF49FD|nr:transmembrane protein 203-like [Ostrea edulis]
MLFKLEEILKWIGITVLEVWLHLISVLVFSFLAVLKYEEYIHCTWYEAFIPLFICDGLCGYFVIIVYVRMYRDRSSVIRLLSSLLSIVLLFVFKVLLCQKLSREKIITFSEVMVPLFALVVIVMFRSCHVNT